MTTEDEFHKMLDRNHRDFTTRLVFADWLDEQGDPRAAGYRALGILRIAPRLTRFKPGEGNASAPRSVAFKAYGFTTEANSRHRVYMQNRLPEDWFNLIVDDLNHPAYRLDFAWYQCYQRRHAEDGVALAFLRLPPERQKQLLLGNWRPNLHPPRVNGKR